jgi:tRNA-2-methylthio-N6-dimethylallyladenosine synthase
MNKKSAEQNLGLSCLWNELKLFPPVILSPIILISTFARFKINETKRRNISSNRVQSVQKGVHRNYGCQMNFSDSEIVASVLTTNGYQLTNQSDDADLVLINTCSIRDNAERKVLNRLNDFKRRKKKEPSFKVGVLGCMAERMKADLLDEKKMVDIVVGPDAYRDLPDLLEEIDRGRKAVNVLLSREETYDDIEPVRLDQSGVTAFISIMRGCDNMCAFCVVPFTRGRERSRDPQTIVSEASELVTKGYREVTLLGQNVDSYHWSEGGLDVNFRSIA